MIILKHSNPLHSNLLHLKDMFLTNIQKEILGGSIPANSIFDVVAEGDSLKQTFHLGFYRCMGHNIISFKPKQ